jgi:hypothetical protein
MPIGTAIVPERFLLRKLALIALGLLLGGCNLLQATNLWNNGSSPQPSSAITAPGSSPEATNHWISGSSPQTSWAMTAPGSPEIPVFVIKTGVNGDPRADATAYCGKLNSRYAQLRGAERAGDVITWHFYCVY